MIVEPSASSSIPCHWLSQAAKRWPERLLISGCEEVTFAEAQERVNGLAGWMKEHGIQKGDRVLMVMPNRVEVLILALAALQQGVIFSILSHQLKAEGLERILEQSEPKAVFFDATTAHLSGVARQCQCIFVDDADGMAVFEKKASQAKAPAVILKAEDLAFLVFTSGSTGTPRGVMLTHGNVAFVCPAIQARLAYTEQDCLGIFLPLGFDYSLYQLFYACLTGACMYLGRPEQVGPELPKILAREKITVLPAVPTVVAALIKMQRYRPTPLPRLRMITNTGDHLPRAYMGQLGILLPQVKVFPMFGLTECKRVSILLPEEVASQPDSVGRPLDGTCVFTVDDSGQRLPPGQAGELVIQGPHLAAGYWMAPEETARRFRDLDGIRSLFTSDQGTVNEQGYITFHSRSESVIKHRGTRLSPAEVEEAACSVPRVLAAGCIKDDQRDVLYLFLATTHDEMNEAGVLAALATRLERGKLPDRVIFLPELPRTGNQKLDRQALRNLIPTLS